MRSILKIAAAVSTGLALLAATASAQAATYLVTYTANSGNPSVANLEVTTTDILNISGGFDVTGISGDVDGDAVTGLIANPTQPAWSYSADGMFMFDNMFFASAPNVSWYGLLFSGASGNEYNLFSDNASTYELYRAQSGVGYLANSVGTVSASESLHIGNFQLEESGGGGVPEPTTWAMTVLGFGAIGGLLRRRRGVAPIL